MADLEKAVKYMENLCNDNSHGYSQINRQGPDYDCSSAIIKSLRAADFNVGGASYTGNMSSELCKHGWQRLSASTTKKRGDILLTDGKHTALYVGNGKLAEFSQSETGGIDGKEGDQTGKEGWIHSYYNFPWKCILRYTGGETSNSEDGPAQDGNEVIKFKYRVRTQEDGWLDEVINLKDFAGIRGHAITDVAITADKGEIWYQVHTLGGEWLPKVTGYNTNDSLNGYAGEGKAIDAIRVYYDTPLDIISSLGYFQAQYHVAPVDGEYFDWQLDDETTNGQDGYAGELGTKIDKFQIW